MPRVQWQASQDFRHGRRDIQRIGFLPHRLPLGIRLVRQADEACKVELQLVYFLEQPKLGFVDHIGTVNIVEFLRFRQLQLKRLPASRP